MPTHEPHYGEPGVRGKRGPASMENLMSGRIGSRFPRIPATDSTLEASAADTALAVAVIDGPYDSTALSGVLARAPVNLGIGTCAIRPDSACHHGTFIMGILGARADAAVPGQCPDAKLLHVPLFLDEAAPSASIAALADAITKAVAAGARIINLSLAITGDEAQTHHGLGAALDRAEASGAIIVAAAGNFGRPAGAQILAHRATIPAVALDAMGHILPSSPLAPKIYRRGVAAPGHEVLGYGAGAKLIRMSGTSVAAAVATGILARVWASRPGATRADIFAAVAALRRKGEAAPPSLDSARLLGALDAIRSASKRATQLAAQPAWAMQRRYIGGNWIMENSNHGNNAVPPGSDSLIARPHPVRPAGEAGECSCGAPGCSGNKAAAPTYDGGFVYVIGTVEAEYPNLAIEREMQVLAHTLDIKIKPDPHQPMKLSDDRRWQHAVLSDDRKRSRYIARQLLWRLTIEDNPVFVLRPRESDLDELIDRLERPKFSKQRAGQGKSGEDVLFALPEDLDVVVGVRGPQTADGIDLFMDQIFAIESDQLAPRRDGGLFGYLAQLSDNLGLSDQERAYNFLAARYRLPYDRLEKDLQGYELAGAPTFLSALSGSAGSKRIVDVVLTFRGAKTMAERKYFLRVDVTHEFPMLVKGLTPYLDR